MIKILLVLVAIIAMGKHNVKDITSYLKKEGAQFLSDDKHTKVSSDAVATKKVDIDRKSGAYRLKASQKS